MCSTEWNGRSLATCVPLSTTMRWHGGAASDAIVPTAALDGAVCALMLRGDREVSGRPCCGWVSDCIN